VSAAVVCYEPEVVNRRFMEHARIGLLLAIAVVGLLAFASYRFSRHDLQVTSQDGLWFNYLSYGFIDVAALVLARRELRGVFLGRLTTSQVLFQAVVLGGVIAAVTVGVLTLTHFPEGSYVFQTWWFPWIVLRSIGITLVLFAWIQTRLLGWVGPLAAACITAAMFAFLEYFQHRSSWFVVLAGMGAYALPFVRWKTGSLGVCAMAIIFADFLSVAALARV